MIGMIALLILYGGVHSSTQARYPEFENLGLGMSALNFWTRDYSP